MLNKILIISSSFLLFINIHCSQSIAPLNDEIPTIALSQIDPQFSSDGKKIVFYGSYAGTYAVHFVDINGNYLGHILSSNHDMSYPTWSPDNQKISILIDGYLYTIKMNGDSLKKLPDNVGGNFCNWSPDGRYIAYTKSICDPDCGIEIYDFKNNTEKLIGQYGNYASWSGDSKRVYYYNNSFITNPNTKAGIYKGFIFKRIDLNTLKEDSLFFVKSSDGGLYLQDCTVSPDESEILFAASYNSPVQIDIWKIKLKSREMIQMTFDGGSCPSYNPVGDKIVYTNSNINEGGLWIMNSDGSNKHKFTKLQK